MTKKVTRAIKAKHVFGELTLRDVFTLVESKCTSIVLVDEGDESLWTAFTMQEDTGLELWESFDEGAPTHSFPSETKVRIKDDHIELESGEEIYFKEHRSIIIDIL